MKAKLYGFDSSLVHDADPKEGFVIDMVRATDYMVVERERDALQEQVKALAAENAELKHAIAEVARGAEDCEFNGDEQRYVVLPDDFDAMTDLLDETTATDAAIREIKAQGVDEFGQYHNFSEKQFIQKEAIKFAAQLRAKPEGEQL